MALTSPLAWRINNRRQRAFAASVGVARCRAAALEKTALPPATDCC
jgi:hypothetical protein